MKFRPGNQDEIEWFIIVSGYIPGPQFKSIAAADDDDKLLGLLGFDYWTPNAVQVHVAIKNVIAIAPLWREGVQWARSVGRKLVYAVTPADNDVSIRLQRSLGFVEQYRQKDGWDVGVDMVINEYRL